SFSNYMDATQINTSETLITNKDTGIDKCIVVDKDTGEDNNIDVNKNIDNKIDCIELDVDSYKVTQDTVNLVKYTNDENSCEVIKL
ncbi:5457_t:CDS:2, partial [Racocetra fulgida]